MNEFVFIAHIWIVVSFALIALRLGAASLTAFIALQGVLANLFVMKQIRLFGFSVTCSDVFAIGGILSLNLLQEYFGKDAARKAVKVSLCALVFFAAMSQIHLIYIPTDLDTAHDSFLNIFSSSFRIVFASLAAFFIVQQFDVRFFSILKGKFPVRVAISLLVTQLLDTVLFSFLGLFGLVESIFDIIFMSFVIKCLMIGASYPFTAFSKRFVKNEV